jgi:ribonuclease HI
MGIAGGGSATVAEVLRKYREGPQSGVFTDGGARPNPGPGGWGYVYVDNGTVINQDHGYVEHTTNNRMELMALINAYRSLPNDSKTVVYSDSNLCVQTINVWARSWKANGWSRKSGPIANLELVQELYAEAGKRPGVTLQWIKAHNGWLWNEYADALSSAWTRPEL